MMTTQIDQVSELLSQATLAGAAKTEEKEEEPTGNGAKADLAEGEDEGEEEVDTEEVLKLVELAEKYGIEPDELFRAKLRIGDDPDAPVISIEQVKDAWKSANSALQEFDSIRSAIDQQRAEIDQQRAQMQLYAQLQVPPSKEEQDALFEYQEMDRLENNAEWWAKLEKESGIEVARQALGRVRDAKRAAEGKLQGFHQQRMQHQQAIMQQMNSQFEGELVRRMPNWRDAEVSKKEFNDMVRTAAEYGVGQQELMGSRDPRLWQMVRELSQLKALVSSKPKPKQKAGKPQRGASRTSKTERDKANVEKLMADAKASGSIRDQTAAVTALLRGL